MRSIGSNRPRSGAVAGVVAGVVGLGCCVGPAVAALVGITSAAVAFDLATSLYFEWGWAFKLGGAASAAAAIALAVRSRRRCPTTRPSLLRYGVVLVAVALTTYGALYAATTWLGSLAGEPAHGVARSLPALQVRGRTLTERVDSAVRQVRTHYRAVELEVAALANSGILVRTSWEVPDVRVGERYNAQIRERVEDSREATVLLLQTVARSNPQLGHLGAYEDRLIMPVWTRRQILAAGDPRVFRDFSRFSRLQLSAAIQRGYLAIAGPSEQP